MVISQKIFNGTIALLAKSLDLRSRNHHLITSNIANVDTPDYKAIHMDVEQALASRLATSQSVPLQRTHSGHLPLKQRQAEPEHAIRKDTGRLSLRGDGNTVDMDRSMARLSENSLLYNTAAQILRKKFDALRNVIQGGGGK